ncbi:Co-chaperone Hsc20 [Hypomontagnella submonticulosa]|nr:Co-chaperone Hsc20 [Hypomontagnella submonticulosa]
MRSSLLPRGSLRRVCDACKQQHGHAPAKSFSHAASIIAVPPTQNPLSSEPTSLSSSAHRTRGITSTNTNTSTNTSTNTNTNINTNTNPNPKTGNTRLQTRHISSSAASKPQEETETDTGAEAEAGKTEQEAKQIKTHYDLFPQTLPLGPPPRGPFAIDVRALRREFLTLQATAHPDLAPAGIAKRRAEAASARINEAYRTLAHPLQRAQYLLWLRGIDAANEETAKVDDAELLMLVLELREAIEEAGAEEELEPIREQNEARIRESEGRLAAAFARDDVPAARAEVTKLRYWVNIRESIQNWERGKPIVLEH